MDTNQFNEVETIATPNKAWFVLLIIYLIIDYARPQDTIKVIGVIRPAMIVLFLLILFTLRNFSSINFKTPQIRFMFCFIFLLALFIPFAKNNHFAFATTSTMFFMMPFILSLTTCISSQNRLIKILILLTILMAYQGQFAIRHGGHGTGSQFSDENDLALFINMWIPICYFLFLSTKRIVNKLLYLILLLTGLGAVIISFSRGGFLGLIGMFAVNWIFSTRKFLTLGILILGAITVVVVTDLTSHGKVTHQKHGSFWSEMATSTDSQNGTGRERVESWKAGWRMFLANPLGVGGNNFQFKFPEYQDNSYFRRVMWGRVAHSLWFTLIPETGIAGIIIYFSLLFINIKDVLKIRRNASNMNETDFMFYKNLSVALLSSLTGFFISATFLSVLYYPHYWYLTALIVVASRIAQGNIESNSIGAPLYVA